MSARKEAIKFIRKMPDEYTTDDIIAELYFKQKVERGLDDIEAGRIISHQEVKERMAKWAKSIGQ